MRISDWSSDVRSSDLADGEPRHQQRAQRSARDEGTRPGVDRQARLRPLDRGAADERIAVLSDPRDQRPRTHDRRLRSEEHTSELQSLMRISYAVFCLKKKTIQLQA